MATTIKSTAVRKLIAEALAAEGLRIQRGSYSFDGGNVTLVVESESKPKADSKADPKAVESTGDEAKDKYLAVIAKLDIDEKFKKQIRRWYGRNVTDINNGKWVISAIANRGDKFVLSPKEGDGRNKRVDVNVIADYVELGRKARVDFKAMTAYIPDGTKPTTSSTTSTPKVNDEDKIAKLTEELSTLNKESLNELLSTLVAKGVCEAPSKATMRSIRKTILASDKLFGRNSVNSHLAKMLKAESKESASATEIKADTDMLTETYHRSYKKTRLSARANWSKVSSKAKFLAKIKMANNVLGYLVGFNVEKSSYRVFDPATGKVKLVKLNKARFA